MLCMTKYKWSTNRKYILVFLWCPCNKRASFSERRGSWTGHVFAIGLRLRLRLRLCLRVQIISVKSSTMTHMLHCSIQLTTGCFFFIPLQHIQSTLQELCSYFVLLTINNKIFASEAEKPFETHRKSPDQFLMTIIWNESKVSKFFPPLYSLAIYDYMEQEMATICQ